MRLPAPPCRGLKLLDQTGHGIGYRPGRVLHQRQGGDALLFYGAPVHLPQRRLYGLGLGLAAVGLHDAVQQLVVDVHGHLHAIPGISQG